MAVATASQRCTLCSLDFKNGEQLKQHVEGKRHKKMESLKEEREKSARRSVFVSGLKKDTFVKQLDEHFAQFGKIAKIVNDPHKNAFAIVEYEEEASVDKAMAFAGEHRVGDKANVRVSRRELKEFVSRVHTSGEKKREQLEKLKDEALVVNKILDKCETFDDQVNKLIEHLKLDDEALQQRHTVRQLLDDCFRKFWTENEMKVCIIGSTENGLACKGSDMDLTLLLDDYLVENRHKQVKLPKIVVKQLKEHAPGNGSSSSKPASVCTNADSSDSNMTAEAVESEEVLDENIELDEQQQQQTNGDDLTLKESIVKFFNDKDYKSFVRFDVEHQVKIGARIVQRFMSDLKTVKTITNTRCPVVNFLHDKANVRCDVSLNNYLAVENTKLVSLYMKLEPNLRKLIFVLRYWFKHKNLYASSSRFNSYTIIWLAIFYMQTRQVGFLPTVEQLAAMTNKVNDIHGWNCAFEDDLDKLLALKQLHVPPAGSIDVTCFNDLLKGFFDFYASKCKWHTDDSGSSKQPIVLCTRSATVHEASACKELSKLNVSSSDGGDASGMNVQDTFDLGHNLTANVSKSTLERFRAECIGSNDLLHYSQGKRGSGVARNHATAANKCWGLMLIMTRKCVPVLSPTSSMKMPLTLKDVVERNLLEMRLDDSNDLDHEMKNNAQEEQNSTNGGASSSSSSSSKAVEFVLFLLRDCLAMEASFDSGEKRVKRVRVLNQICDRVDSLGLTCSPKRLRTGGDEAHNKSSTYVCVFDESLNNNNKEEGEGEQEVKVPSNVVAVHHLFAKSNTWQGRRVIRRELRTKQGKEVSELELEKMTSQRLMQQAAQGTPPPPPPPPFKGIHFKIEFLSEKNNSDNNNAAALSHLKIKFGLLDEIESQSDLLQFTTLVHFLDVYINNCRDKLYNEWLLATAAAAARQAPIASN